MSPQGHRRTRRFARHLAFLLAACVLALSASAGAASACARQATRSCCCGSSESAGAVMHASCGMNMSACENPTPMESSLPSFDDASRAIAMPPVTTELLASPAVISPDPAAQPAPPGSSGLLFLRTHAFLI